MFRNDEPLDYDLYDNGSPFGEPEPHVWHFSGWLVFAESMPYMRGVKRAFIGWTITMIVLLFFPIIVVFIGESIELDSLGPWVTDQQAQQVFDKYSDLADTVLAITVLVLAPFLTSVATGLALRRLVSGPVRFRDGLQFLPYGFKVLPLFVLWVAAFMLLSKLSNGGVAAVVLSAVGMANFFVVPLIIDQDMGVVPAMRASVGSVLQHGKGAAGFFILMLLISFATIMTLGALWFLMFPLLALAHTYAYWGVFGIHKTYRRRNVLA